MKSILLPISVTFSFKIFYIMPEPLHAHTLIAKYICHTTGNDTMNSN